MTTVDDYRRFLKCKLMAAESILDDATRSVQTGEIAKGHYKSMWRREIKSIQEQLHKEWSSPEEFAGDAEVWRRREMLPLH